MRPVYTLRQVTKKYAARQVLNIECLEIMPGEIFALVGPSGAGKSTLLRILNFLEPHTSGSYYFEDNAIISSVDVTIELRRRVTTVFQRPVLLNTSVWENVAYGLRIRGKNDHHEHIQAILGQVGLSELANQRARTLSGGEAQRVALARALVIQPDVLLLDEPTANLDPSNVQMIESIIRQANNQRGATCVLVTHNIFQAHRVAHRVGFMLDGNLIEVAPVDLFFEHPQDVRTAAFVRGDMVY